MLDGENPSDDLHVKAVCLSPIVQAEPDFAAASLCRSGQVLSSSSSCVLISWL